MEVVYQTIDFSHRIGRGDLLCFGQRVRFEDIDAANEAIIQQRTGHNELAFSSQSIVIGQVRGLQLIKPRRFRCPRRAFGQDRQVIDGH